ncbi:MAG TPA: hypothetical protein VJ859_06895 [Allosphingosinicella sp.]|nr:hypothetical protein [Allosphingosinicella sp.]
MKRLDLRLGPIDVPGQAVSHSGISWLCSEGHLCRAGELIAYCNISLASRSRAVQPPLAEERYDFQLVFAAPASGIVRRAEAPLGGGFLDRLSPSAWSPDFVFGWIDDPGDMAGHDAAAPRLLMVAGRRMTVIANQHHGLMTGWHNRIRAWWGDGAAEHGTLVAMGTCELEVLLRGEDGDFQELFDAVPGPAQLILVQDEPLVLCARVILEQLGRSAADHAAIREDFATTFAAGPHVPEPADWLFMGAVLDGLGRSPLAERCEILRRDGVVEAAPPQALLMSLAAELPRLGRHRRLGYHVAFHPHRLNALGAATTHWLRENFEPVLRGTDDIRHDYEALLEAVEAGNGGCVLSINGVATRSSEQIHGYAGFPAPLAHSVGSVRALELNLMLADLARSHGLGVIDADAIAADLGLGHVPDGFHGSAAMQAAMRAELVRQLAAKGVRGFAPLRVASADGEVADPRRHVGDVAGQGLGIAVGE